MSNLKAARLASMKLLRVVVGKSQIPNHPPVVEKELEGAHFSSIRDLKSRQEHGLENVLAC